jgi:Protein of unknown function (DUF1194)
VLAADVSRSIDQEEFELQRRGYAAAVTSARFLKAIASGPHGAVALCFVEWAGVGEKAVVADWTVIRDGEGAAEFAKVLLEAPRSSMGRTAIGDALDFAVSQLETVKLSPERRVIDVSGDGTSNSGRLVTGARDDAVAKGITINGLAIINEKTSGEYGGYLWAHTHPPECRRRSRSVRRAHRQLRRVRRCDDEQAGHRSIAAVALLLAPSTAIGIKRPRSRSLLKVAAKQTSGKRRNGPRASIGVAAKFYPSLNIRSPCVLPTCTKAAVTPFRNRNIGV